MASSCGRVLCVNIKSGFIEATHRPEIRAGYDVKKLKNLLLNGDEVRNMDSLTLWNVLYFNGTEKLISAVEKFNLRSWGCVNLEKECEGFVGF